MPDSPTKRNASLAFGFYTKFIYSLLNFFRKRFSRHKIISAVSVVIALQLTRRMCMECTKSFPATPQAATPSLVRGGCSQGTRRGSTRVGWSFVKPEHSVQIIQRNTGSGKCANRAKTTGEFAKCDGVKDPETGKCSKCKGEWSGQGCRFQNCKNTLI